MVEDGPWKVSKRFMPLNALLFAFEHSQGSLNVPPNWAFLGAGLEHITNYYKKGTDLAKLLVIFVTHSLSSSALDTKRSDIPQVIAHDQIHSETQMCSPMPRFCES